MTCENPLDTDVENSSDGKKRVKRELQEMHSLEARAKYRSLLAHINYQSGEGGINQYCAIDFHRAAIAPDS